jgi:hypothetical protein
MPTRLVEDLDDSTTLGCPAQAASPEVVADPRPRRVVGG